MKVRDMNVKTVRKDGRTEMYLHGTTYIGSFYSFGKFWAWTDMEDSEHNPASSLKHAAYLAVLAHEDRVHRSMNHG